MDFVQLVGRSHECDYPPELVENVPVLTSQQTRFTTPKDVDDQVHKALQQNKGLYELDFEKLRQLQPDVVVTQSLCNVCSIDYKLVEQICSTLDPIPDIVSLNPHTLNEVIQSFRIVGQALRLEIEADMEILDLNARVEVCKSFASSAQSNLVTNILHIIVL